MRCLLLCSGAGEPTPVGASVQSLPSATEMAGFITRCGSTTAPLVQRGDSMAGPCRGDCEARQMIQLGAVIGTGSTAWERRLAVNPSVGVRRQLPLHKGGPVAGRPYCLCLGSLCLPGKREYDSPGIGLARRGSTAAPLVQRGDSMAGPCRGDCKARQMIQLGAVIGTGSTAWPSRHGTGSTAWERRHSAYLGSMR